jgi:phenylacetate-CoA ligase
MVKYSNLLYCLYYGLKVKGNLLKEITELEDFARKSPEAVQAYQARRLKGLLNHADRNVPFYAERFRKAGFSPGMLESLADLEKIPLTGKEDLRANFPDSVRAANLPADRFRKDKTSGSTNAPFEFFKDTAELTGEDAARLVQYCMTGYRLGDKRIIFRGEPESGQVVNKFYQSMRFISCFGMDTDSKIDSILLNIRDYSPVLIESYPSTLVTLAKRLKEKGESLPIPIIITSGEMLTKDAYYLLSDSFEAEIFNMYGAAEAMYVAMECRAHNGLHIDAKRFIVEVVDRNGKKVKPGTVGDVVITSLTNHAMPFIRYRVGDRAMLSGGPCTCGNMIPRLQEIKGRSVGQLSTADGRVIDFPFFATVFDDNVKLVRQFKLVQLKKDLIEVQVVPNKGIAAKDLDSVMKPLREYVGPSTEITLKIVDDLPLGRTGKRTFMESRIR